jgi:type 1 glutamine amidotransferase
MGPITRQQSDNLAAAVRAGAGFAGWHGGIVDSTTATTCSLVAGS